MSVQNYLQLSVGFSRPLTTAAATAGVEFVVHYAYQASGVRRVFLINDGVVSGTPLSGNVQFTLVDIAPDGTAVDVLALYHTDFPSNIPATYTANSTTVPLSGAVADANVEQFSPPRSGGGIVYSVPPGYDYILQAGHTLAVRLISATNSLVSTGLRVGACYYTS